jgi:hypothetical protein
MGVFEGPLGTYWRPNRYPNEEREDVVSNQPKLRILRNSLDAYNTTVNNQLDIQPEEIQECIDAQLDTLSHHFKKCSQETFMFLAELVNRKPEIPSTSLLYAKMMY